MKNYSAVVFIFFCSLVCVFSLPANARTNPSDPQFIYQYAELTKFRVSRDSILPRQIYEGSISINLPDPDRRTNEYMLLELYPYQSCPGNRTCVVHTLTVFLKIQNATQDECGNTFLWGQGRLKSSIQSLKTIVRLTVIDRSQSTCAKNSYPTQVFLEEKTRGGTWSKSQFMGERLKNRNTSAD